MCSIRSKEQVAEVMVAFKGKVRQMLRHSEASSVVEYAYNDKAILSQRLMLTEELYGNTFQICKVTSLFSSASASSLLAFESIVTAGFCFQSSVCPTIEKVLENNPDKVESIMEEMKQILTPMAQK